MYEQKVKGMHASWDYPMSEIASISCFCPTETKPLAQLFKSLHKLCGIASVMKAP